LEDNGVLPNYPTPYKGKKRILKQELYYHEMGRLRMADKMEINGE